MTDDAGETMQKNESGKSNVEVPDLRVTGSNPMSRKHWKSFIALCLMAASLFFTSANAQETTNKSKPEQSPTLAITKKVINVWPGVAPGSEQWKQPETALGSDGFEGIVNVTTPTLTAYLPDPSIATGTAVIIAPGGGFISLAINSEGHHVVKWLVARGITAIVLSIE
jgi:hypothetical protein